jgi:hypothetical protein
VQTLGPEQAQVGTRQASGTVTQWDTFPVRSMYSAHADPPLQSKHDRTLWHSVTGTHPPA